MSNGMALGMIEAIGLTPAAAALDAAVKAADVRCVGVEKIIGVNKLISVTISLQGEVAAVQAAVEAGTAAGNMVGTVAASRVIPSPHQDVHKLVGLFRANKAAKPAAVKEEPKVEAAKEAPQAEQSQAAEVKKK